MQRFACRIQPDHRLVLHHKNTDRIACSILLKPLDSINSFQAFHNRFFYDRLDIRWAEQLAFHRCCLRHPEFRITWQTGLPWQCLHPVKQFLKCCCMHRANLQQDTLCTAQENIRYCDRLCIPEKRYPSILHTADLIAKVQDLSFEHSFQAEMARRHQFI